jgi:hypothetical protein
MAVDFKGVKHHILKQAPYYMAKGHAGYRITSDFQPRRFHPLKLKYIEHLAIDLTGAYGWAATDYIIAPWDGVIEKIERNVTLIAGTGEGASERAKEIERLGIGGGNYVQLRHNKHIQTVYKHLQFGTVTDKKVGDVVSVGETLGYMGSTGMSTGAHLHFEVIVDGVKVDPKPYLLGEIQVISDYEGGEEMGYPILKDNEYVNSDMAKKNTDETKASITKLQQILVHKYGYQLSIDGKWTSELDRAVRDYQMANGLEVDGRVGPATIKSLNRDLYTEIKELRKALVADPEQEKEIEKLKLDKARLQEEKSQLTADLNTANSKIDKIKTAVDILKTL